MSHLLERYGDMAAFASLRQPAWHGLGTVFETEVNASQMLKMAHMAGWDVRLVPIVLPGRSAQTFYAVVRTSPFDGEADTLGVVGERYKVLQNEDLFTFGDNIGDGARWETAGSIRNGRVVFGSLAIERETILDPNGVADKVKSYLLVHSSHDGSLAIQASITPVRVVCQNTLNMAVGPRGKGAKQSFRIRHTETVNGKVQAAREALGLTNAYMDAFDVQAKELIETQVSMDKFYEIVNALYPKPTSDSKIAITKHAKKIDTIGDIYVGQTQAGITGTAWGVVNALTERLDWFRNPQKGDATSALAAASGFDAATNAEKNRILSAVKELVLV